MAILESRDKIISVTNDDNIACGVLTPPAMYPLIQDIMEIDIGKERRYDRPLWRT